MIAAWTVRWRPWRDLPIGAIPDASDNPPTTEREIPDEHHTRWILFDPAHSSAEFRVPHFWGLVKVKGHFDRIDGWLEVDDNGFRRLELVIDAASVNTGNRRATNTSAGRLLRHRTTPRRALRLKPGQRRR